MEEPGHHEQRRRPDRGRPRDGIRQEDVRHRPMRRAQAFGQRRDRADAVIGQKDGGLDGDGRRRDPDGPVSPAEESGDHEPGYRRQFARDVAPVTAFSLAVCLVGLPAASLASSSTERSSSFSVPCSGPTQRPSTGPSVTGRPHPVAVVALKSVHADLPGDGGPQEPDGGNDPEQPGDPDPRLSDIDDAVQDEGRVRRVLELAESPTIP